MIQSLLVLAYQIHTELHLLPQQTIHALHAQTIHKLTRQAEGNRLRNAQQSSLFEQNPEVDMNELAGLLINHDVPQMAISQSHYIPNDAVNAERGNEVLDVVVPQFWMHKSLQKEVVEDRSELFRDRLVKLETLLLVLLPDLLELLQNRSIFDLSRMITTMCRSLLRALPTDQKQHQTQRVINQIISNG